MKPTGQNTCEHCGFYKTEPGESPDLDSLEALIASMFHLQTDVITSKPIEGNYVYAFGVGTVINDRDKTEGSDDRAVVALARTLREQFQRTFGERSTGRRFWWRQRPVVYRHYSPEMRATKYSLWFDAAIENLTAWERDGLSFVPENTTIRFDVIL